MAKENTNIIVREIGDGVTITEEKRDNSVSLYTVKKNGEVKASSFNKIGMLNLACRIATFGLLGRKR